MHPALVQFYQPPPSGVQDAPGGSDVASETPSFWATLWHILLFVPYTTGYISWGYANGLFPIRPFVYQIGMGLLCLWSCRGRGASFPKTSLVLLLLIFSRVVDIGLLQRFPHPDGNVTMAVSISSTLFIVFVALVSISVWIPRGGRPIFWVALLTMCIGTVVNILESIGIGAYSSVPGRAAGFLTDANDSAIAIINGMTVCIVLTKSFWRKGILLGVAMVGVVPTFSRSGMLVFGLMCLVFGALHFRTHAKQILTLAAVGITAAVVGLGAFAMTVKDENAKRRFQGIFGGDTAKMGSSERVKDLQDGLDAAMAKPVFGQGTGAGNSRWQPHNQFVSLWVDQGLLIALLFLGIWLVLAVKCWLFHRMAILAILPHIAFIPFTQMQLEAVNVLYTALIVAVWSSRAPIRFRLFRPRSTQGSVVSHPVSQAL